jgi:hypothetical protein
MFVKVGDTAYHSISFHFHNFVNRVAGYFQFSMLYVIPYPILLIFMYVDVSYHGSFFLIRMVLFQDMDGLISKINRSAIGALPPCYSPSL